MDTTKNDKIDIIINDNNELIIDFNLVEVGFDVPELEVPELTDEF